MLLPLLVGSLVMVIGYCLPRPAIWRSQLSIFGNVVQVGFGAG